MALWNIQGTGAAKLGASNKRGLALTVQPANDTDKGITVAQAATAMRALAGAGILVHAYLIYGYPTQTAQETIDALATVRALFAEGCLHSAYWHRFALTLHAPAFRDQRHLRLKILDDRAGAFARNEVPFLEPGRPDPARYGPGLHRAVYNFMYGVGLEHDVRSWFDFPMPRPKPDTLPRASPG